MQFHEQLVGTQGNASVFRGYEPDFGAAAGPGRAGSNLWRPAGRGGLPHDEPAGLGALFPYRCRPPPPPPHTPNPAPVQVLALVAACGLNEPRDVARYAATGMRCAAACRAAPLCLRIRAPPGVDSPLEEQAAVRAALQGVCASWPGAQSKGTLPQAAGSRSAARLLLHATLHFNPFLFVLVAGTAELDLRGCPLEDRDVAAAAAALPRLASLHLSGCKKLTPGLLAGGLLRRPALRTVTLQRCFQLTSGALTDVLAAAGAPGSRLACAALSHLSLADWPEAAAPAAAAAAGAAGSEVPAATAPAPATRPAAAAARGPPPAGGLRMLALQNCTKLGHGALAALADACPSLEALMLGGTSFAEAFAAAGDGTTSAGGDGDASEAPPAGLPAPLIERFYDSALDALAEGSPLPALLGSDTSYASYIASIVAHLAALVAQLPRLRVLELTFGLPGLAPALQRLAVIEVGGAGRVRQACCCKPLPAALPAAS